LEERKNKSIIKSPGFTEPMKEYLRRGNQFYAKVASGDVLPARKGWSFLASFVTVGFDL